MEDFKRSGYNDGRGHDWKNRGCESPKTDSDRYSYRKGYEEGENHRKISEEIDKEMYGNNERGF